SHKHHSGHGVPQPHGAAEDGRRSSRPSSSSSPSPGGERKGLCTHLSIQLCKSPGRDVKAGEDHSFAVFAPKLWSSSPAELRSITEISVSLILNIFIIPDVLLMWMLVAGQ
ncbi:hypothetical protein XENOCAPTIV_015617, partial [Xenoophorus captivus]